MTTPFSSDRQQKELPATIERTAILLLAEFHAQFPSERDCVEELARRAKEADLLSCRYCGNKNLEKKYGDRIVKCTDCNKRTWFTAGTFFERARHTRPCMAHIWLLERGVVINSSQLHRLFGIAQSSALTMIKKITTVIANHMGDDSSPVRSSLFRLLMCRRSRETPARAHPSAEQDEIDKDLFNRDGAHVLPQDATSDKPVSACDHSNRDEHCGLDSSHARTGSETITGSEPLLAEASETTAITQAEKQIYELLTEKPLHVDTLSNLIDMPVGTLFAALTMLELSGLAVRLPGDSYIRNPPAPTAIKTDHCYGTEEVAPETALTISAIIDFVRRTFNGISRKYLQNYLAAHWVHVDRKRWHNASLLNACIKSAPINYAQIITYVSPPTVRILPCG